MATLPPCLLVVFGEETNREFQGCRLDWETGGKIIWNKTMAGKLDILL